MSVQMLHPQLAALGISSVVVKSRGALERGDNGIWTVTISLLEFIEGPPRKRSVKVRGSVPAADADPPATVETAADRALRIGLKKLEEWKTRANQ